VGSANSRCLHPPKRCGGGACCPTATCAHSFAHTLRGQGKRVVGRGFTDQFDVTRSQFRNLPFNHPILVRVGGCWKVLHGLAGLWCAYPPWRWWWCVQCQQILIIDTNNEVLTKVHVILRPRGGMVLCYAPPTHTHTQQRER
jgi:hypothetical protein